MTHALPDTDTLAHLTDLADLAGKRVLIAADIDVAQRQASNDSHFKISRLAKTVAFLLEQQAAVQILGAQGSTSVRLLEAGNAQGLDWHRRALAKSLLTGTLIDWHDRLESALSDGFPAGTVTLLPNSFEVTREENTYEALNIRPDDPDAEWLVREACENAMLPTLLRDHYDVFILDDFRSVMRALPANVGLAAGKPRAIGLGLQGDLESLERLVERSRALKAAGHNDRICFVGSSRPESAASAWSLLEDDLFDRIMLGPIPSMMIYRELGYALGSGPSADLDLLMRKNQEVAVLATEALPQLVAENRLRLPTDFLVANGVGRGKARRITPEGLEDLGGDDRIMSIGPETVNFFANEAAQAELIFHFGMMSGGVRPYVSATEAVIRANLESPAEVFMSGDHIVEIAEDIGLLGVLRGYSTSAQIASSLLTGSPALGLAPFQKS